MLTPRLRAARGGPEEDSRRRVSSSAWHSRLQLLTHTGCRDLSGFRAKLGHKDLSGSKDAPVHNTHVKRAGGICHPVPLLWGIGLTPIIPLLAARPASDRTHLSDALLFSA